MTPMLEVRDLRVSLGSGPDEALVVDGVSLTVAEGEVLGLVGESGCGKTMTALSLLGLLPAGGRVLPGSSVRFRGEEIAGAGSARLRMIRGREIAMVFQEPSAALNPVLPVGEQVAEGMRHHFGLGRSEAHRRAVDLLEEVGLPDPSACARRYPHELSGGMGQRVTIAMALASSPHLLVADEPATALDPTVQAQIMDLLAGLRESRGLAMILIAHDLGLVAETSDRVAVMYAGQIVEVGPCRDVFSRSAHPYTTGLLGSLPRPDDPTAALKPIPGRVPDPTDRPPGCRFAERCPEAWERCAAPPPLFERVGSPSRAARCWLVEESSESVSP